MPGHTIFTIGLFILLGYAAQRLIHKRIIRLAVTGLIIFGILGAFMHPGDVVGWVSNTAQRFWPIIMSGAQHGTDSCFTLINGISRAVK